MIGDQTGVVFGFEAQYKVVLQVLRVVWRSPGAANRLFHQGIWINITYLCKAHRRNLNNTNGTIDCIRSPLQGGGFEGSRP